ncbi:hypothetical protein FHS55_002107 [Angulomicrobium tetraedrale]|uniref:DUF4376 domain-containing protein n=1 Tax=Ancylobacter tetraedralis TaxID=217068 RepID=A0A839Z9V8_9HYPH|nr:hypothetical protein [Ancylobacter tetraedralis]MBB3771508.1 hypothetical protein [Ancylobacter tetraedralis]
MKYLRIKAGLAVETFESDGDIETMFHPSLIWAPASEADVGWSYADGVWSPPPAPPEVDLIALKSSLKSYIDAEAEAERVKYITAGAGQAMTYQAKAEEARRLADDASPAPSDYPLLSAEIGITAGTLADVGAVVLAAYQQWLAIGAAIEAVRLGGKKAVDAAATPEAAQAAAAVIWPAIG